MKRLSVSFGTILLAALACGGGGGGGGGGPVAPPAGISFVASGGVTTNGLALGIAADSSPTTLRLHLNAQGMTNLYGVAFDLLYPSQVLRFTAASQGSFLGGTQTALEFEEVSPGRVVVGMTRLGNVPGATGSGAIVTLEFASLLTSGSGTFSFSNNAAFSPSGAQIGGVTWSAGSVTVVQ